VLGKDDGIRACQRDCVPWSSLQEGCHVVDAQYWNAIVGRMRRCAAPMDVGRSTSLWMEGCDGGGGLRKTNHVNGNIKPTTSVPEESHVIVIMSLGTRR
jgi:hypothetical protein